VTDFSVPMPARSSLKRSSKRIKPKRKPQVRVGKVSGTVRLSGAAMERLREQRYEIDGGRCTWKQGEVDACGIWLPLYGSVFNRAHLAHILGHGAGGGDTIENTRIRCFHHHIELEHVKGIDG
jgi:hypothetical protein